MIYTEKEKVIIQQVEEILLAANVKDKFRVTVMPYCVEYLLVLNPTIYQTGSFFSRLYPEDNMVRLKLIPEFKIYFRLEEGLPVDISEKIGKYYNHFKAHIKEIEDASILLKFLNDKGTLIARHTWSFGKNQVVKIVGKPINDYCNGRPQAWITVLHNDEEVYTERFWMDSNDTKPSILNVSVADQKNIISLIENKLAGVS